MTVDDDIEFPLSKAMKIPFRRPQFHPFHVHPKAISNDKQNKAVRESV